MPGSPNFYIGNIREDAKNGGHRGWLVGSFMAEGLVQKNDAVEVLYWEFPPGETKHTAKKSEIVEVTIIMKGRISGIIEDKTITLNQGEYVVIKPGTLNNIAQNALEEVAGITIKAPSDPNAKKVISWRYYRVNL